MNEKIYNRRVYNISKKVHSDKYDYSKTIYIKGTEKIEVTCKKHGTFFITASSHLTKRGCKKCGNESKSYTTEEIVEKFKDKHGNKYDYSKVDYTNNITKVQIICPIHGEFSQLPSSHLKGVECFNCGKKKAHIKRTEGIKNKFIDSFRNTHDNKYDYSKFDFVNTFTKSTIICKKHGEFEQTYSHHIEGNGCPKCGWQSHRKRSEYIEKANGRICIFYVIRCFNDKEEFYKIGITMNDISTRYYGTLKMPYEYEVISEVKGSAGFIWDLEVEEKRKLKDFKYLPKKYFGGAKTECFTKYEL